MNIEHVALNVPDPVALADWYVRHFGMRVVRSIDVHPHTRFLADGAGRTVLEVYRQKAPVPDYAATDALVLHVAFTPEDIDKDRQRLLVAGATAEGEVVATPEGDRIAWMRDPWGVAFQLVKRAVPML